MDSFTDQHSKDFLNKEWLVRIDNATSQPYLFVRLSLMHQLYDNNEIISLSQQKFLSSTEGRCSILITDTANVWFEDVDSKQLSRRWRQLNQSPEPSVERDQELAWRARIFRNLSSVHTLKAMQECVFSIEYSHDADLAFELQVSDCKWRWECYLLSPKTSAKILSRHLIFPLLSVTHLAFSSPDPVCELDLEDLQQAVDKVAKTGRHAHDVHVRQTLSRPRLATTLARMTALFNFVEPIPPIISDVTAEREEDVNVDATKVHMSDGHNANPSSSSVTQIQHEPRRSIRARDSSSPSSSRLNANLEVVADPSPSTISESASRQKQKQNTGRIGKATPGLESSSATEPETDDEALITSVGAPHHQTLPSNARGSGSEHDQQVGPSSRASSSRSIVRAGSSSDSSQPRRASKKAKLNVVPEDSDASGNEATHRATARPPSRLPASVVRGASVRQPIKRGGRRF